MDWKIAITWFFGLILAYLLLVHGDIVVRAFQTAGPLAIDFTKALQGR